MAVLAALVGYLYGASRPPEYVAESRVTLKNPYALTLFRQERGVPYIEINRYLNGEAARIRSWEVATRASELLEGGVPPAQVRQRVQAEASTTINEIVVRVRGGDPEKAAAIANAVTTAYNEVATAAVDAEVQASVAELAELESELQAQIAALSEQPSEARVQEQLSSLNADLSELQQRARQIRADGRLYGAGIQRVDSAPTPEEPVTDSPRRTAAIVGFLGFLAALILAFWRSERVQLVEDSADAAEILDAPPLGALPRGGGHDLATAAAVTTAPRSDTASTHRFIAASLALRVLESAPRVLLVTSIDDPEGATAVALNLSLESAQEQREVILVDADDSASLTELLGATSRPGWADLLHVTDGAEPDIAQYSAVATNVPPVSHWTFIPFGSPHLVSSIPPASAGMAKLLTRLSQASDLIVLQGSPLLDTPDTMRLAGTVDGVVLVVPRGTSLARVRQARDMLGLTQAPLLGYVFNARKPTRERRRRVAHARRRPPGWLSRR